jgi:hypothetical protein
LDVEDIYLQPPDGDESDGYDLSDTEEGHSGQLSRTILQVYKGIVALDFYTCIFVQTRCKSSSTVSLFVKSLCQKITEIDFLLWGGGVYCKTENEK